VGDNRRYEYRPGSQARRAEFGAIAEWVPPGAKVLDLGCGDGSLLELLLKKRKVRGEGMEVAPSGVEVCRNKGLEVRQGRIDEKLPWADDAFDIALCNVTLQMVMYPEKLLTEMARVAPKQIVSFPNFANLKNRLELMFLGRMPRAMLFGHFWWNTGHVHQLSLKDFKDLLPQLGLNIRREVHLGRMPLKKLAPNLLATLGIFELARS
jgi:methionine biosynthesis protein MetW